MTTFDDCQSAGPPPYASSNSRKPQKHPQYYFDEGDLIIQVNEYLFKVWSGALRRHSQFFQMTTLPGDEKLERGLEDPIVLESVQAVDFERLLWIIHPPIANSVYGTDKAKTAEEWISVLDLSTRWEFKDIRSLSIRKLAKLEIDPIEKVELMLKYKVNKQWAYTAFIALCSRDDALNVHEGRRIGIEMTINISTAREKLERCGWGRRKPEQVKKTVCEVFKVVAPELDNGQWEGGLPPV